MYHVLTFADDIQAPSKNFVFLTAEMQKNMSSDFPLIRFLPWNHFGRKNVGYLYAILHGATTIWDFDDDNILLTNDNIFEMIPVVKGVNGSSLPDSVTVREAVGYGGLGQLSFNPYPLMGCPSSPCKYIHSELHVSSYTSIKAERCLFTMMALFNSYFKCVC